MANLTRLLRRQPQTSEAELEFVRERTVARLHGLSSETGGIDAAAVAAEAIELGGPSESAEPADPVAITVVAERSIDFRSDSIWEAPVVEREPARRTHPPRPRPPVRAVAPQAPPSSGTFCPYCAVAFDPPPTATRRCVRCRQRIIVKHVQGRVVYLTEAAVAVFDAERQRSVDVGRWTKERAQWLRLATSVRAPAERIAKLERARLTENVVEASRSLYRSTAERAFREARRDDRWETASRVRRAQAAAIHKLAGSPVPPPDDVLALHRDAVAAELRGIGKMAKDAQLLGSTCCEPCHADDGRTFRIANELRSARLPHQACPKGLCRCRWDLAVRDEQMVRRYLQRKDRGSRARLASSHHTAQSGE